MLDDRIGLLLSGEVTEEHEIEDLGIGAYEYWGFKGVDRHLQIIGMVSLPIPDGMSREEAAVLLREHREYIREKLHASVFGVLPRWNDYPEMMQLNGRLVIADEYSADPPTKAEREYEEA